MAKSDEEKFFEIMNKYRVELKDILDRISKAGQELNDLFGRGMGPYRYLQSLTLAAKLLTLKSESQDKIKYLLGVVSACGAMCHELSHIIDKPFNPKDWEQMEKAEAERTVCLFCKEEFKNEADKEYLFGGQVVVHNTCFSSMKRSHANA